MVHYININSYVLPFYLFCYYKFKNENKLKLQDLATL